MIKATTLITSSSAFSVNFFVRNNFEIALKGAGHHKDESGRWFNEVGEFLGASDKEAVENTALDFTKTEPVDYVIVDADECRCLVAAGETVRQFSDLLVWCVMPDGMSFEEAIKACDGSKEAAAI